MQTRNTHDSKQYNHGITCSFTDNGNVVIVRTQGDMSRNAINTWASLLILTMQEWQSKRPFAIINNLSHPQQGLNPFARQRSQDVIKAIPEDMLVYSAVVLPRTFMYHIMDMFLRSRIFQKENLEIQLFNTEAQAIKWLREQLAKH
ncbi:MAG: hypothetical protein Crog4KO_35240 [Crocinitomicaceae bacterium]